MAEFAQQVASKKTGTILLVPSLPVGLAACGQSSPRGGRQREQYLGTLSIASRGEALADGTKKGRYCPVLKEIKP